MFFFVRRRRAKQRWAASDQSHLSSALPEMLLSAFSPRHFISIVALSCFILSRFSLLLFTWFDRVLASGSKTVTLMSSARVWSGRSVSGCAGVIELRSDVVEKRDWGRFNKGHFCSKVSDRLTLCLQSDTRWQKMKVSNVGRPRFTGLNIISRFEQK